MRNIQLILILTFISALLSADYHTDRTLSLFPQNNTYPRPSPVRDFIDYEAVFWLLVLEFAHL